jgi:hypothetical protein
MSDDKQKTYLFDNPRNVRRVVFALVTACVILTGLDLVVHRHVSHPWEAMFGFYAVYGFVACVLLVLLAKEMRKLLIRKENYYDEAPSTDNPQSPEDPNA